MWRSKLSENRKIKEVINTQPQKSSSPELCVPSNYNQFFSRSYDSTIHSRLRKDTEKDEKEVFNGLKQSKDESLNALKSQHNTTNSKIGLWRNKTAKTPTTPRLWYIVDGDFFFSFFFFFVCVFVGLLRSYRRPLTLTMSKVKVTDHNKCQ
jgi:hypothetical protein